MMMEEMELQEIGAKDFTTSLFGAKARDSTLFVGFKFRMISLIYSYYRSR